MRLILLLVVCQSTISLRPDAVQVNLEADEDPCEVISPSDLCKKELQDGQCFLLVGQQLPRTQKRCTLRGPKEGFATVRANASEESKTSVSLGAPRAHVSVKGGLIFHGIRLEFDSVRVRSARLQMHGAEGISTGGRTRSVDGGAIWAGKRGLKIVESGVYVNVSSGKAGGAIYVGARGQLLLTNRSSLVTENTRSVLPGGSIFARNFRMENGSVLGIRNSSGKDGGAIAADMFVVRKGCQVHIKNTESARFGGAVSSSRRLVVQYGSEVNITNTSTEAPGGGGIYAGKLEVKNATIDIQKSTSRAIRGLGGCLYITSSVRLQGGSVQLSQCSASNAAGFRAGGVITLKSSSILAIERSVAKSGVGALLAHKVHIEDSLLRVTDSHSAVPPAAVAIAFDLYMIGGTVEVSGTSRRLPWPAIVMGSGSHLEGRGEQATIRMTNGSKIIVRDAYSGIFGGRNSSLQLQNCVFEDLNDTAVDSHAARELRVSDASVRNVGAAAFSCLECRVLNLTRIHGKNISTLVRASGLHSLALEDVQAHCTSRDCLSLGAAPSVLEPKPWVLKDLDIHLENVDGAEKPVVLDLQAPKVLGSVTSLQATCPPGSFSLVQQTFGNVVKHFRHNMLMDPDGGFGDDACCVSTSDIPETFRAANRSVPFVLLPNLTEACEPATSSCLCTDGRCQGQMRKAEVAYVRISCMECPVGQYSLVPVARPILGSLPGGIFDSTLLLETRHEECISCDQVEVDKKPLCQGSSVIVPRGIMASPIGLQPNSTCSERRLCFYRCPNADACPGGEVIGAESACAPGYSDSYPGCADCASGYGRKNTDPFECLPCGEWNLSALYFLLLPLAPVVLAVRSASQTEKERMAMMIKVLFSFGTFVANLHTILAETEIYQTTQQDFRVALGIIEGAGDSSTLVATSFDCLVHVEHVTRWHHLILQAFHPVVLLIVFCLLECTHCSTAFQASFCRRCIVLGNAFLPGLFATFFQWSPCFHMQLRADKGFDSYAAYYIKENCPTPFAFSMPMAGFLLFLTAGPIFWAALVRSSRKWDPEIRKTYVGFLIAGYQEKCEWWEIAVLLRKALLTAATVFMPVDYAPLSLVIATALIMLAALVGHLAMKPYADEFMNVLEGGVLTYSMAALMVTLYLGSRSWSSTSKPAVFGGLVVSMAVTSLILLCVFLITALPRASARSAQREGRPPAG